MPKNQSQKKQPTKSNKNNSLYKASRLMVKILRHSAREIGLQVADDGYVKLTDLLEEKSMSRYNLSLIQVQEIVSSCNKQRMGLKQDEDTGVWYIRANQGHSKGNPNDSLSNPDNSLQTTRTITSSLLYTLLDKYM